MQQLWAPWRMELIEQPASQGGCIFCDLPRSGDDRAALILGRTQHTFAILNRYPYSNGHLMVVPQRHVGSLEELRADESAELAESLRTAVRLLGKAYAPQGYNLGMNLGKPAGAGIADHLHWHAVPRWNGDTNFMPVLGDVKVMIEHIQRSWERLRPLFDAEYR